MACQLPLVAAAVATLASNRAFHQRTGYRWFVEGAVVWVTSGDPRIHR